MTASLCRAAAAAIVMSPLPALAFENVYRPVEKIPFVVEWPGEPHRLGFLWGKREIGPAGTLLKVPGGWRAPIHAHTADYRGVVIKGTWSHWVPETGEGKGVELRAGSYWTQKADQMHGDACLSATGCVVLLINDAPYKTYLRKRKP